MVVGRVNWKTCVTGSFTHRDDIYIIFLHKPSSIQYLHNIYTLSTQLICCTDYTELGTMRLSVELPGLLVAGPDSAQELLATVATAARNLNIPTTQVGSRAAKQGTGGCLYLKL